MVAHGIYNRNYRGEIKLLIYNPALAPIQVAANQTLGRRATVPNNLVHRLSAALDVLLGVEPVAPHDMVEAMATSTSD